MQFHQDCSSSSCICTIRPLSKPHFHLSSQLAVETCNPETFLLFLSALLTFSSRDCGVHSTAGILSYLFPQRAGERDSVCNERDHWDDVRWPVPSALEAPAFDL